MSSSRREHKSSDTKHQSSSHHQDDEYESDQDPSTPVVTQTQPESTARQVKTGFAVAKSMEVDSTKAIPAPAMEASPFAATSLAKPSDAPFGTNLTFFNHQKYFVQGNQAISKHSKHIQQQDFGTHTRDHKSDDVLTHVLDDKGNVIAERHYTVTETIIRRSPPKSSS